MSTQKNLRKVLHEIEEAALGCHRDPKEILLVVVSKNKPWEKMEEAYLAGCRDFGENRVNDALLKIETAPQDIRWHFIGKLQKNKVAKIIGRFTLIHSVDSLELAEKIAEESVKRGLTTSILLETNTSGEESKSGLSPEEWKKCFSEVLDYKGLEICGLMTMAPLTEDEGVIRQTFSSLTSLRDDLERMFGRKGMLTTLSMGMSNDFRVAIEEGSTLVRIGSAIFAPT